MKFPISFKANTYYVRLLAKVTSNNTALLLTFILDSINFIGLLVWSGLTKMKFSWIGFETIILKPLTNVTHTYLFPVSLA